MQNVGYDERPVPDARWHRAPWYRLAADIAADIADLTGSADVAVVIEGEHLCMTSRGIRTPGRMITSVMRGAFRTDPSARLEFLRLADRGGGRQ